MGVVVTLAIIALVLIGIPIVAARGESRRGAYLAVAVIFSALTFGCYEMMNTPNLPAATEQDRLGQDLMGKVSGPLFLIYAAGLIGSLIGAAIFREAGSRTRACPHCAESIQAAAVVCRFCGRDVPAVAAPQAVQPDVLDRIARSRTRQSIIAVVVLSLFGGALIWIRMSAGETQTVWRDLHVTGGRYIGGVSITNLDAGEMSGCDVTTRTDGVEWYADISARAIDRSATVYVSWDTFKSGRGSMPADLGLAAQSFLVSCKDATGTRKLATVQPK